jgi:hypothetical protein
MVRAQSVNAGNPPPKIGEVFSSVFQLRTMV